MKSLNVPECTFQEVFTAATPKTNTQRKMAMDKFKNDILDAGEVYQAIVSHDCLADIVSLNGPDADERVLLSKAYNQGLVLKASRGRRFYDQILSGSMNCAYCACGVSYTLDHVLPKTNIHFPDFSVLPINLVPCCRDCNTEKDTWVPTCSGDSIIHPYFENFTQIEFLKVVIEIEPALPVTFKYEIDPTKVDFARFNTQFENLKLGNKFSLHASSEFTEGLANFKSLYALGAVALQNHCQTLYNSAVAANPCSWRAAFYKALIAEYPYNGDLLN